MSEDGFVVLMWLLMWGLTMISVLATLSIERAAAQDRARADRMRRIAAAALRDNGWSSELVSFLLESPELFDLDGRVGSSARKAYWMHDASKEKA